jgi:hypothetical protein
MGKYTQIVVKSKDCTESGFPKRLSVYHLGEPRKVGLHFNVPVLVLRENDLSLPQPSASAPSAEIALKLASRHYQEFAKQMKLDILISDLPDSFSE